MRLSLGASAPGEVHRLVTYIFVWEVLIRGCGALSIPAKSGIFADSFEKNIGTVSAVLPTLFFLKTIVSRVSKVEDAKGFLTVAFATLGTKVWEPDALGYWCCLDILESAGSELDNVFPFSLLKRRPGLKYIPERGERSL